MLEIAVASPGFDSAIDITEDIRRVLPESHHDTGMATVVVIGSTCGLSVMRYEPGAISDLLQTLDRVAPRSNLYGHQVTTGDPNGASHLKSILIGGTVSVPVRNADLALPGEHRIVLLDFDLRAATRRIVVQVQPSIHVAN
ncbi:YjbQ family protein [Burkholderia cenocepacia]|uniref:YjbQ family protein n=1 Tax=Burkholderia cenocepacia TaxID=95486 RepID=UPI000D685858|nr:YjbQ family protein [Burkholderia cenocepacia]RQU98659.1 YjbQ family protein [Burkholderia cenocepacia]HDR9880358.1 YjbQ family protein [Burkholderia cenocepacia]HDR9887649.1 YjbQ family protein [Burkholderia cenocepacia]